VAGDVTALPVPSAAFDLATSFDVIYSLDDAEETRALEEMRRVLVPGGLALINVAALEILRGSHSALALERRRYTVSGLRAKLDRAGFDVLRISYTNFTTLPITLAVRLAQRALGHRDEAAESEMSVPMAPVNAIRAGALAAEAALLRLMPMPAGSSVICIAKKRK
jgi:SAM-dependent methyltransferase